MSSTDAVNLEVKWGSLETHDIMPLGKNLKVDGYG